MMFLVKLRTLDLSLNNQTYIKVLDYYLKNNKKITKIKTPLLTRKSYQFFFKNVE